MHNLFDLSDSTREPTRAYANLISLLLITSVPGFCGIQVSIPDFLATMLFADSTPNSTNPIFYQIEIPAVRAFKERDSCAYRN